MRSYSQHPARFDFILYSKRQGAELETSSSFTPLYLTIRSRWRNCAKSEIALEKNKKGRSLTKKSNILLNNPPTKTYDQNLQNRKSVFK